jgi:16S rRNA processing protein RimM
LSTTDPDRPGDRPAPAEPTERGSPADPDAPEVLPEEPVTLLEVGRIAKPHGLAGQVVVDLVTNRTERLDPGTVLTTSSGLQLLVEASQPFLKRWIVNFSGVTDRRGAERLRGQSLLAEPVDDPDALWVHELVGSDVEDKDGRSLGKVVAILANPASDLLELEGGGLIPLVFVVDQGAGRVVVDIPEGLIE